MTNNREWFYCSFSNLYSPISILLLAFALRIYRLDFQPLWWDEGISVYLANREAATILANRAKDVHPPLYFLLLQGWTALASNAPFAVRHFSLLFGTLSVAALYTLARRLSSRFTALLAALILAISPFQVHHAQEARMYPLVTMLALLSTYLLMRALDHRTARWSKSLWIGYTLTIVLALLTHYYAIFIPLFQGVYVFLRHREVAMKWVTAMVAGVVLYAPWLGMIAGELPQRAAGKVAAEADPARSPMVFIGRYLSTVTVGYHVAGLASVLTAGVAAGLILLGLFGLQRQAELPVLYLGVPLAGGLLLNQVLPFEAFPRLLAHAAPAAYLLIAAGLIQFQRWRLAGLAVTGLALIGLVTPYPSLYAERRQSGEDYRPTIDTIDELAMAQDLVVLDFPWQAGYLQSYSRSQVNWWIAPGSTWASDSSQMNRDLDQLLREHPRLWYVAEQGLGSARGQNIEGYLIEHAHLALDQWYGTNRLLLFGTRSADRMRRVDISFGQHIRLMAIAMPDSGVPGDVLPVQLDWQATGAIEKQLKVFVHLLDTAGHVAAQRDTEPVAGLHPTNTWQAGERITDRLGVLIPQDAPAGRYEVELGVYDPGTAQRLPVSEAGRSIGDRLLAGPVMIRN
ncbi:MAG: glycosyltransferase family 39 protein [Anaerolineae bacterium]